MHPDDRLERPITRREFLCGAALAGAYGLVAAGCSLPIASAATRSYIRYWNLFGGGDGVRMVQMEGDFVRAYPNIGLKAATLSWGAPYYTKLAMAAVGGRPPNVAILHMSRLPGYAPAGLLDPFDLNLLAEYGLTQDKFLPAIWQEAHYNGKLYAIPLDTHPFVMYYNTDVCKKAGLLGPDGKLKPLIGPDAVIDAFQKAQKVTGTWGLAVDSQDVTPWRMFYSLYSQLGGKVLTPNGKQLILDNAKAEKALSFMRDLTVTAKVAPANMDYGGAVALFGSQKAGFHWNGEWEVTTFQDQKIPFNMTLFPNVFGNYRVQADSHTFVIPHSISQSEKDLRDSLTFISFMLKDSLTWARGGHIPAYLPVANSAEYKQLKPQSNYAEAAKYVVYDPSAWFSGSGSQLETDAGAAFQAVLGGAMSPQQAINQFRASMQKLLSTPAPVPV